MIIDDVRKLKAASEEHSRVASKQTAMLSQVMSALELEMPPDSSEEPDAPAKDGLINMVEIYLRSSEQTKQEPSLPTYRRTSEQVTNAPRFDDWQPSDPTTTLPGSDNSQPFDRRTYDPETGTHSTFQTVDIIAAPIGSRIAGRYIVPPFASRIREKLDGLSKIFRK
ncbi:uncharacterized protein PFLUO_LOCUS6036 [Penicillium psychrofluorescens]|uniref:uncharacterized protein n=1 Tax=Penicillium psychrofluorescens TaxID=3158075 RepID=UPI003CCE4252